MNREIKLQFVELPDKRIVDARFMDAEFVRSVVSGDPLPDGWAVREFTGLHDAKGREIYEGDIIHDERTGRVKGCVVMDKGAFRLLRTKELPSKWLNDLYLIHYTKAPHSVCGDIYSTPDLLNSKDL